MRYDLKNLLLLPPQSVWVPTLANAVFSRDRPGDKQLSPPGWCKPGRNTIKFSVKLTPTGALSYGLGRQPQLSKLCHCKMLSPPGTRGLQFCTKRVTFKTNLEYHVFLVSGTHVQEH